MASSQNMRVARDIKTIQNGENLSLAVAFQDADFSTLKCLIVGPVETPYELGFFEFLVKFPKDYPTNAPIVKAITTDNGRTRFNPNIYAEGKVCLSILGTWHGESCEQWSPVQSLESVLLSIQSLMSSNPYENEPGYEKRAKGPEVTAYVAKIHHETLRISVIKRLEGYLGIRAEGVESAERVATEQRHITTNNPDTTSASSEEEKPWEPFENLCKRRFLWYYTSYCQSIDAAIKKHGQLVADGKAFALTPFEFGGNRMSGTFNYSKLKKRLATVRDALNQESEQWVMNGRRALDGENPLALAMSNEFRSLPQKFRNSDTPLDFEMINNNPFVWRIIVFGKPMTNLDEGIFKIKMVFSTKFPEEQPRVTVETPIFHHRVSPDGVLCYLPDKEGEFKSHVEAAVQALVGEATCPDMWSCVNPEASELLWGSADQKKMYNRKLRRSAQESGQY